jgi:UDP-N-acetylmuramoyl-tripeptide--D-alanyl-D-alanine ligase
MGMPHFGRGAADLAAPFGDGHFAGLTIENLEAFDSVEGIAREKAAIFDGLLPGGTAIVNADLATTPILLDRAAEVGARIVDIYIMKLRAKLGRDAIRTVWGLGWVLPEKVAA